MEEIEDNAEEEIESLLDQVRSMNRAQRTIHLGNIKRLIEGSGAIPENVRVVDVKLPSKGVKTRGRPRKVEKRNPSQFEYIKNSKSDPHTPAPVKKSRGRPKLDSAEKKCKAEEKKENLMTKKQKLEVIKELKELTAGTPPNNSSKAKPTLTPVVRVPTITAKNQLRPIRQLKPSEALAALANEAPAVPSLIKALPDFIQPFVNNVLDVKADGHCGFRVVGYCLGRGADSYMDI